MSQPSPESLPLQPWGAEDFTVVSWPEQDWHAGWNSRVWLLERDGERAVLKAVPEHLPTRLRPGLEAAEIVEAAGIPAGAPYRTTGGDVAADADDWTWVLLRYVPGRSASAADHDDLALAGRVLGRVHTALSDVPETPETSVFTQRDWLTMEQPFLVGDNAWIPAAIEAGFAAMPADLSTGLIHGDPQINDFRVGPEATGLIDWAEVLHAPYVFDLGILLSTLGAGVDPEPLLAAYLSAAPVKAAEFAYLPEMMKIRAAIEGWIFASRDAFGIELGDSSYTNAEIVQLARGRYLAAEALAPDHFLR
ncbi:hypothetical protein GCM10010172_39660 [Paractinoplanes ferrugineus]|uniref:Aminoglycoside phosphotransferase domain-containing protein n=1 Tax=Paractinoplanes ferrugineus TaxID=113564 RepID=A0A919J2I9_9ACTN|nr:phosphotransferase [Actinoplanes ferrugineus]GIE12743.1 hypothetical protein Afe05nite_45830 [Actinoplanes ferrugineus]